MVLAKKTKTNYTDIIVENIISQKIIETEWNSYCNPFDLYLFY